LFISYNPFLGVAHRLHLVVCNGLGIWIRKKSTSSSSHIPTTSNCDPNDIDSDEEDYTDDIQLNPHSSSPDNSSSSIELLDQSFDTSNNLLNNSFDPTIIVDENFVDDEPDNLSMDITDNWSIDVIEELDAFTGEIIQEDIGVLMKKCRSIVKLMNKSSILMNYVVNLKKQFNICLSLQLDCKHRWSSTHHLVEVMLKYRKIINKINSEKYDIGLNKKQTNKISSIELDQFDWNMLEMIDIILRPFAQATNLISGSQYPTIGIAYFSIVQIREFLEDSNNIGLNDNNMIFFIQLKQLLLKQIEKYFIGKAEQWDIMKVRIFVFIYWIKNRLCIKNYAYFDPIGYGCLTRRERRAVEVNIMEIQELHVSQENDEDVDQTELTSNKKQKSKQSSTSSMTKFLSSIGKNNLPSSSNIRSTTKKKLNEEIITYRSLAQKEYSDIVDSDKEHDVVSAMQLKLILFHN